jgi:hypothetical protein
MSSQEIADLLILVSWLIDHGCLLETVTKDGLNAIEIAKSKDFKEMIIYLDKIQLINDVNYSADNEVATWKVDVTPTLPVGTSISFKLNVNAVQDVDKDLVPATEYYIPHYDEDGEVVLEYRLDLWFLIKEAEASDEDILGALAY